MCIFVTLKETQHSDCVFLNQKCQLNFNMFIFNFCSDCNFSFSVNYIIRFLNIKPSLHSRYIIFKILLLQHINIVILLIVLLFNLFYSNRLITLYTLPAIILFRILALKFIYEICLLFFKLPSSYFVNFYSNVLSTHILNGIIFKILSWIQFSNRCFLH